MRIVLSLLLCLALATLSLAVPAQFTGMVVSIADGDTIFVLTLEKQLVKVHLYGIDAPEKDGQAFGNRARRATSDAVLKKDVTVQPIETDRSDRTVAIVFMPDGGSLNMHLVREGMAWVCPQYCKHEEICEPLRSLEHAAMEQKRGLWADKEPVPPWIWRRGKIEMREDAMSYMGENRRIFNRRLVNRRVTHRRAFHRRLHNADTEGEKRSRDRRQDKRREQERRVFEDRREA